MKRSALVGLVAAAAAASFAARRRAASRGWVSVAFEDGSVLDLAGGAPEAEPVLEAARRALEPAP